MQRFPRIKFWAVGFDDCFPCARNRYEFGVGAVLFTDEKEARAYARGKVVSCREFVAYSDCQLIGQIGRHRLVTASHLRSLGLCEAAIEEQLALFDRRTA